MNIADVSPVLNVLYAGKASAQAALRACDGFALAPWVKRAGAGHCVHNGYLHLNNGWDYARQTIVDGHYRTNDFVTVERAIEPIGMLPVTFGSAESFDGKIWRANGLWDYPFSHPGTSHTTSKVYSSDTGGLWTEDLNAPPVEREVSMLRAHEGYLYLGLGERYNVAAPPTYTQPRDIWRRAAGGTTWEQRSSTMAARRSFAHFSWPGHLELGCGRDDTVYPGVTDLNDFIASTDGGATWQSLGNAPFRGAYGRLATPFAGGILLTGGAYGVSGETSNTAYLNEAWFSTNPLDVNSWVACPPMPIACIHHMAGVLTINGTSTFAMIGGYNSNARPDGSPYGTIFTTPDPFAPMTARRDSGFWVEL